MVEELKAWQSRPLERVYLVVHLDVLVIKIRDKGRVRSKSAYLMVGARTDGHQDILGPWLADTEGAKFWLAILNELKNRGIEEILCCSWWFRGTRWAFSVPCEATADS